MEGGWPVPASKSKRATGFGTELQQPERETEPDKEGRESKAVF